MSRPSGCREGNAKEIESNPTVPPRGTCPNEATGPQSTLVHVRLQPRSNATVGNHDTPADVTTLLPAAFNESTYWPARVVAACNPSMR